jgi:rare lipoprotein A
MPSAVIRSESTSSGPARWTIASALVVLCTLTGLAGCASPPYSTTDPARDAVSETGLASWYDDSLHGRPTASGEPYDRNALTAAHRTLPFGTTVRVARLDADRSVVVTINDRGPFVEGRIIDLSRRAAEELDMIHDGVARVRVVVVD